MIYRYYKTDGTIENIKRDAPLKLEELQKLVGGYIEMKFLQNGHALCFDEEGLLKKLPRNPYFNYLVGNVIEGKVSVDGEFVGVDMEVLTPAPV